MKNLLTSLRASNETYNSMKHSARAIIRRAEIPLLAVIVLYKAATNLLFVPLMQQLWSLMLRFAPMHYLSNNNASEIFSSPAIILCITLIAILTAFWALYEFSVLLHWLDLARKGETIRLPALLRTSLADIRHAFLPQNWLVLVYSAVLIPFTNFFLAYNYITQLAVPEYIMGVIRANSRYYLLYLAAGAALLFPLCQLGAGAAAVRAGAQKPVAVGKGKLLLHPQARLPCFSFAAALEPLGRPAFPAADGSGCRAAVRHHHRGRAAEHTGHVCTVPRGAGH